MSKRTDTYDDEQWQLVPKKLTTTMGLIFGMNDSVARTDRRYERFLAAAPNPPAAAPDANVGSNQYYGLEQSAREWADIARENSTGCTPIHWSKLIWFADALAQRGEKP